MDTFIQVATQFEAAHLIRALDLRRTRLPGLSHCYRHPSQNVLLWISGIGELAIKRSMIAFFQHVKPGCTNCRWINAGIAACSDPSIRVGSFYQILSVQCAMPAAESIIPLAHCNPSKTLLLPNAHLLTTSEAVSDSTSLSISKPVGLSPLLFDMETYHWATSLMLRFPASEPDIASYKVVSDHADGQKINFHQLAPVYDQAMDVLLELLA